MVYDYVITIKRPDYRSVDQVSQLLYIFAIIAFSYFFYLYQNKGIAYLVVVLVIILSWGITIWRRNKNGIAFFRLGLFLAAIGWVIGPQQNVWMCILYAIAGLLEKQVKFPQEIGFAENEIAFNSFPKKKIEWAELSNVVIKDGIITIDFKNNKLIQKEVDQDVPPHIEVEFNTFCIQKIRSMESAEVQGI